MGFGIWGVVESEKGPRPMRGWREWERGGPKDAFWKFLYALSAPAIWKLWWLGPYGHSVGMNADSRDWGRVGVKLIIYNFSFKPREPAICAEFSPTRTWPVVKPCRLGSTNRIAELQIIENASVRMGNPLQVYEAEMVERHQPRTCRRQATAMLPIHFMPWSSLRSQWLCSVCTLGWESAMSFPLSSLISLYKTRETTN